MAVRRRPRRHADRGNSPQRVISRSIIAAVTAPAAAPLPPLPPPLTPPPAPPPPGPPSARPRSAWGVTVVTVRLQTAQADLQQE